MRVCRCHFNPSVKIAAAPKTTYGKRCRIPWGAELAMRWKPACWHCQRLSSLALQSVNALQVQSPNPGCCPLQGAGDILLCLMNRTYARGRCETPMARWRDVSALRDEASASIIDPAPRWAHGVLQSFTPGLSSCACSWQVRDMRS